MKNTASFETAMRLKEAGFPQPEIETGQVWFNLHSAATLIGLLDPCEKGLRYFYCHSLASGRSQRILPATDDAFFAPTATDILYLLQKNTRSPFWWTLTPYSNEGKWGCIQFERLEGKNIEIEMHNPAEAAALAWLEINENKAAQ
jgi:hypothetical protein